MDATSAERPLLRCKILHLNPPKRCPTRASSEARPGQAISLWIEWQREFCHSMIPNLFEQRNIPPHPNRHTCSATQVSPGIGEIEFIVGVGVKLSSGPWPPLAL